MKINQNLLRLLTGLALATTAIPILLVATGRSTHLSCEKLEKNYVMCQLEKRYVHGLWPTTTNDLRLTKVNIESQLRRDDDGKYYTYKTYLHSPREKHLLYHYGRNKFSAEIDKEKLNILINGPIKSSLQLTRSYWLSDLFAFIACTIIILIFCAYFVEKVLIISRKY